MFVFGCRPPAAKLIWRLAPYRWPLAIWKRPFPRFCGLCRRMRFAPKPLPCLKIVSHPCRLKIEQAFGINAKVYDIEDFDIMRPQDFYDRACIMFPPSQMFRITQTSKRRIYATHEHFEPHFNRFLPNPPPDSLNAMNRGRLNFLLLICCTYYARWWCWMRRITLFPIYRVKYCNALIRLVFIEWTATPREPKTDKPLHNVLISIPAEKLQAEEMVKLPDCRNRTRRLGASGARCYRRTTETKTSG